MAALQRHNAGITTAKHLLDAIKALGIQLDSTATGALVVPQFRALPVDALQPPDIGASPLPNADSYPQDETAPLTCQVVVAAPQFHGGQSREILRLDAEVVALIHHVARGQALLSDFQYFAHFAVPLSYGGGPLPSELGVHAVYLDQTCPLTQEMLQAVRDADASIDADSLADRHLTLSQLFELCPRLYGLPSKGWLGLAYEKSRARTAPWVSAFVHGFVALLFVGDPAYLPPASKPQSPEELHENKQTEVTVEYADAVDQPGWRAPPMEVLEYCVQGSQFRLELQWRLARLLHGAYEFAVLAWLLQLRGQAGAHDDGGAFSEYVDSLVATADAPDAPIPTAADVVNKASEATAAGTLARREALAFAVLHAALSAHPTEPPARVVACMVPNAVAWQLQRTWPKLFKLLAAPANAVRLRTFENYVDAFIDPAAKNVVFPDAYAAKVADLALGGVAVGKAVCGLVLVSARDKYLAALLDALVQDPAKSAPEAIAESYEILFSGEGRSAVAAPALAWHLASPRDLLAVTLESDADALNTPQNYREWLARKPRWSPGHADARHWIEFSRRSPKYNSWIVDYQCDRTGELRQPDSDAVLCLAAYAGMLADGVWMRLHGYRDFAVELPRTKIQKGPKAAVSPERLVRLLPGLYVGGDVLETVRELAKHAPFVPTGEGLLPNGSWVAHHAVRVALRYLALHARRVKRRPHHHGRAQAARILQRWLMAEATASGAEMFGAAESGAGYVPEWWLGDCWSDSGDGLSILVPPVMPREKYGLVKVDLRDGTVSASAPAGLRQKVAERVLLAGLQGRMVDAEYALVEALISGKEILPPPDTPHAASWSQVGAAFPRLVGDAGASWPGSGVANVTDLTTGGLVLRVRPRVLHRHAAMAEAIGARLAQVPLPAEVAATMLALVMRAQGVDYLHEAFEQAVRRNGGIGALVSVPQYLSLFEEAKQPRLGSAALEFALSEKAMPLISCVVKYLKDFSRTAADTPGYATPDWPTWGFDVERIRDSVDLESHEKAEILLRLFCGDGGAYFETKKGLRVPLPTMGVRMLDVIHKRIKTAHSGKLPSAGPPGLLPGSFVFAVDPASALALKAQTPIEYITSA